ncbi:MAG: transcription antitermination factor NusB [Actinobacteria bacterium]|nr:transcription antitermination factor NusB [Actinomycetota bacterium]
MSARSKARKQSLDLLYEGDIRGQAPADLLALRDVIDEGPDARPIREYTKELIFGIAENRRKIDELISTYAQGWDMDRLPAVDRNILRLGIYEILWSKDLEDAIAIDEALNLAKELSTDDSATYIHGVLGRIASIKDSLAI